MSEERTELITLQKETKASISCRIARCPLPLFNSENCLLVSFSGTIENTTPYEGGYSYMHAMIGSGFAACNPATLILDLRELKYDADEYMSRILDQRIITKVMVSDLNRSSLTKLVQSVLFLDPQNELFETFSGALSACDSAYRQFLRDGRKRTIAADF